MSDDRGRDKRNADHLFHVWINRRQSALKKADPDHHHEHSLYEFKDILQFLEYGHTLIQRAFEGKLDTTHQQCSHQAPVPIKNNVLKCACMGQEVTTCPMLLGLKTVFEEDKAHYDIPVEHLYRTMAKTCAWHSYKISCNVPEGAWGCDLSEGVLMDESDRMFWSNVYSSLSQSDEEDPESEG